MKLGKWGFIKQFLVLKWVSLEYSPVPKTTVISNSCESFEFLKEQIRNAQRINFARVEISLLSSTGTHRSNKVKLNSVQFLRIYASHTMKRWLFTYFCAVNDTPKGTSSFKSHSCYPFVFSCVVYTRRRLSVLVFSAFQSQEQKRKSSSFRYYGDSKTESNRSWGFRTGSLRWCWW